MAMLIYAKKSEKVHYTEYKKSSREYVGVGGKTVPGGSQSSVNEDFPFAAYTCPAGTQMTPVTVVQRHVC